MAQRGQGAAESRYLMSRRKSSRAKYGLRSTAACPGRTRVRPERGCDRPEFPRDKCGRNRASRSQSSGDQLEGSGSNGDDAEFLCVHPHRPDGFRFHAANGSNHRCLYCGLGAPYPSICLRKRRQLTGGGGKSSRVLIIRFCGSGKGFFSRRYFAKTLFQQSTAWRWCRAGHLRNVLNRWCRSVSRVR